MDYFRASISNLPSRLNLAMCPAGLRERALRHFGLQVLTSDWTE